MRQMHLVSICVVAVLAIALIAHLRAQESSPNSNKASNLPPNPVAAAKSVSGSPSDLAASSRVSALYSKLPLSFEANQGQADSRVRFLARGGGYSMYLTPSEVLLSLHRYHGGGVRRADFKSPIERRVDEHALAENVDRATVSMQLIGSNPDAESIGVDPLPGKDNYLIGSDPRKWHTDVPTYAKVRLSQVYAGVDLVYYGNQDGQLEHDFVVAPNADPSQIEFDLRDQDRAAAFSGCELSMATNAGDVKLRAPLAYQLIGGQRKQVEAAYEDAGSGHIRFRLGSYDNRQPLVIDPVLVYSAVFGGTPKNFVDDIYVQGIGIDSERNVYIAGILAGDTAFPLVDPYQSTPGGGFVSKLNAAGTALLYSTYFGGNSTQFALNTITVDALGRAYLAGSASAGDIPIVNAAQPTFGGSADGFITVLNPAGDAVEWSTYIGGSQPDSVSSLAVDQSGNLYAAGATYGNFPASHNFSPTECSTTALDLEGVGCAWVAKYNSGGALQYSTLYAPGGGTIAVDSEGSAYIAGMFKLFGADWAVPTTPGAYSTQCYPTLTSNPCWFVAKLSPSGDSLVYSTTLGATSAAPNVISVDRYGDAYVGGSVGTKFPIQSNAFQKTCVNGCALVFELNPAGSAIIASTYLGGGTGDTMTDSIYSIALDQYGQVYVAGQTASPSFPLKTSIQPYAGPYSPADPGQSFVTTLSGSLTSIAYYSTYLGTANAEPGPGPFIAVDPALNVYVAWTDTGNIQPTPGAYAVGASSLATNWMASISKLTIMDDVAVALSASPTVVAHGSDLIYTIAVTSKGPDFGVNVKVSDPIPAGTSFVSYDAGGGTCSVATVGVDRTLNCTLARLNAGATWTVKLTVRVYASSGGTLSDRATAVSSMQDFVPGNNSVRITTKVD